MARRHTLFQETTFNKLFFSFQKVPKITPKALAFLIFANFPKTYM